MSETAAGPCSSLLEVHESVQFHDLPQPIETWRNATVGTNPYRVSGSGDNAEPELGNVQGAS